jgi:hypothetical protein
MPPPQTRTMFWFPSFNSCNHARYRSGVILRHTVHDNMWNPFKPHSRRHERVCRDPVRAPTEDTNVIYFEKPSESGSVNQLVFNNAHAAEPDLLGLGIQ